MNNFDLIDSYLERLKRAIDNLNRKQLIEVSDVLKEAQANGKAIYILGNGGSSAAAAHFSCDLNKGASYGFPRRYHAFSLSDNISTLMAYANDVSFEDIFIEQLKNCLREGDVVVGLSGSGNSKNILKAFDYVNQNGGITVGITGYPTGKLREYAKHNLNLDIDDMQLSEDLHIITNHLLVNLLTEGEGEKH